MAKRIKVEKNTFIKVTKCSDKTYWYYKLIGKIFKVIDSETYPSDFKVKYIKYKEYDCEYIIGKEDCVIVKSKFLNFIYNIIK